MATIYGTTGSDTRNGTSDQDTIYGWARGGDANSPSGNDTLNGLAGNDKLYSGTAKDSLKGGAGNDTLNGGNGSDTLDGGTGNDTYIIAGTLNQRYSGDPLIINDYITEAVSSGTDTVQLIIQGSNSDYSNYFLDSNLENLTTLKGQEYQSGIVIVQGNAMDNVIKGGPFTNEFDPGPKSGTPYQYGLQGGGGNDKLYGEAGSDGLAGDSGNDTLIGGTGEDQLNGGLGKDTLIGGTGNEFYFIESTTDTITEYFNEGEDWVISDSNYTLGENSNLENVDLEGSAISGTGNSLDNKIYGNNSNNYLYGAEGNDFIDDYNSDYEDYFLIFEQDESSNDYLDGGAGNDTLVAGDGNDSLYGDTGNDSLTGGAGNDTLVAGDGNDSLYGDTGNDSLTGGTGADNFAFAYPSDGIDTITDFSVVDDTIRVEADDDFSTVFYGELNLNATITPEQFVTGSVAVDKSDRFIYNQKTGALFFDSDGTGKIEQVQFASLSTGLAMTYADIYSGSDDV